MTTNTTIENAVACAEEKMSQEEFVELFADRQWDIICCATIEDGLAYWIPDLDANRLQYTHEFMSWWFEKGVKYLPRLEPKVRKFVRILNVYRLDDKKAPGSVNELMERASQSEETLKREFEHLVKAREWKLLYILLDKHAYLFKKYCKKNCEANVIMNLRTYNFTNKPAWEAFKTTLINE